MMGFSKMIYYHYIFYATNCAQPMKKHFFFIVFFSFLIISSQAQTNGHKKSSSGLKSVPASHRTGWSVADKEEFMRTCTAELQWRADSAKAYCSCMLQKIEIIYPVAADADALTSEKAIKLAKECLKEMMPKSTWTAAERKSFMTSCKEKAALALGEAKAEKYCDCVLQKVEIVYPSPLDSDKITQEEITKWAKECLKNDQHSK